MKGKRNKPESEMALRRRLVNGTGPHAACAGLQALVWAEDALEYLSFHKKQAEKFLASYNGVIYPLVAARDRGLWILERHNSAALARFRRQQKKEKARFNRGNVCISRPEFCQDPETRGHINHVRKVLEQRAEKRRARKPAARRKRGRRG